MGNTLVDVIGIITDDSNCSISFTVWGDACQQLDLKPGNLIACKSAKISDYGGKSINGSALI
jgi:hypothetical protein